MSSISEGSRATLVGRRAVRLANLITPPCVCERERERDRERDRETERERNGGGKTEKNEMKNHFVKL